MRIYLTGFMGCGKTTLGKRLAHHLGYEFVDLDKEIELKTGLTIPEYFQKFGEDEFRKIEGQTLKNTLRYQNAVIATGGGAPCFFDNMSWMNLNGITVYLSVPPQALAKRLENATQQRPVLQGLKGKELEAFISDKLAMRDTFYNQAELVLSGIDLTAAQLASILEQYQRK